MASRTRSVPLRFSIGQSVQINSVIRSADAGQAGMIVGIESSQYVRTLDKYTVQLASGARKTFWDIQLSSRNADGIEDLRTKSPSNS